MPIDYLIILKISCHLDLNSFRYLGLEDYYEGKMLKYRVSFGCFFDFVFSYTKPFCNLTLYSKLKKSRFFEIKHVKPNA